MPSFYRHLSFVFLDRYAVTAWWRIAQLRRPSAHLRPHFDLVSHLAQRIAQLVSEQLFDAQPSGLILEGRERLRKFVARKTRLLDGSLCAHAEFVDVEHYLQHRLLLYVATRRAESYKDFSVARPSIKTIARAARNWHRKSTVACSSCWIVPLPPSHSPPLLRMHIGRFRNRGPGFDLPA